METASETAAPSPGVESLSSQTRLFVQAPGRPTITLEMSTRNAPYSIIVATIDAVFRYADRNSFHQLAAMIEPVIQLYGAHKIEDDSSIFANDIVLHEKPECTEEPWQILFTHRFRQKHVFVTIAGLSSPLLVVETATIVALLWSRLSSYSKNVVRPHLRQLLRGAELDSEPVLDAHVWAAIEMSWPPMHAFTWPGMPLENALYSDEQQAGKSRRVASRGSLHQKALGTYLLELMADGAERSTVELYRRLLRTDYHSPAGSSSMRKAVTYRLIEMANEGVIRRVGHGRYTKM